MAPTFRRRLAVALLATASALVAPRPLAARRRPAPVASTTMNLKDTIGNIFVPPPPPPPVTVVEGAASFRMLGVPPNAEYDEIKDAITALKEKYAGDTKRLLKIDVAKDKISELRLRQRVSGTFGVTAEVAARDKKLGDFENQAFSRAVTKNTPKWIRKVPYMYKPFWKIDESFANRKDRELQRAHTKTAGLYWCGFAAAATFFPGALTYIKFGAPLILVSHLAQRGQPPVPKDERGMAGAVRDPAYGDYLWSAVLLTVHSIVGNQIANLAVPFLTLMRPQQIRFIVGTGCMALGDAIWQPHMEK